MTGFIILGLLSFLLLAAHSYQSVVWERKERRWEQERSRLVDAALSSGSGDFRVRQTTPVTQYDGHTMEQVARPNKREPRPIPIGL